MQKFTLLKSILFITASFVFSIAKAQMIVTVAGNGVQGFTTDGIAAITSELNNPYNVAVDASRNIFIADYDNNRIRKVTASTGIISTLAGTGTAGFSGDSGLATQAKINQPRGIAIDEQGNVYFADQANFRIRKVDAATGIITTVAGNGAPGYSGNNGPATAAMINFAHSIAIDPNGDLVIADTWNHLIRKVTMSTGIIKTIIGSGFPGFSGDSGLARIARLNYPTGIAIDASGNIYITDQQNNRVRKVTAADSLIHTIAGNGIMGYYGDGGLALAAQLNKPVGVAVDAAGVVYVADSYNNRVRKIDLSGMISSLSGTGVPGYNGDSISCYTAELNGPSDMTLDNAGNIYFCDAHNYRVRKILKSLVGIEELNENNSLTLFPNPTEATLAISTTQGAIKSTEIYNVLGEKVMTASTQTSGSPFQTELNVSSLTPGIYFVTVKTEKGNLTQKLIKN